MSPNDYEYENADPSEPSLDVEFLRKTWLLPNAVGGAARDYYSTLAAAELPPLPVTLEKVQAGYTYLLASGLSSAHPRRLAWVVALHKFPLDFQAAIGADKVPSAKRGSARSISPEPGKFATLEAEIAALKATAMRPATDDCDEHDPKSSAAFKRALKRALIVANRLYCSGYVNEKISLDKLLAVDTQAVYNKLAYGLAPPREDGGAVEPNKTPTGRPVLQFRLFDDFTAITMLASARFGAASKQAESARASTSAQKHPQMSEKAVSTVTALSQPTSLRKIRDLELKWIAAAEKAKHAKTRVRLADLAAGMAILRTMLPRPGDFARMVIDGNGVPIMCRRHPKIVGDVIVPEEAHKIIVRRNAVRGIPLGEASMLFPGTSGKPQLERSVTTAFTKATRNAGLLGLTPQRMRDVCAKMMSNNDPGRYRLIAAILGYSETRTASRRYGAFRRPSGKAG